MKEYNSHVIFKVAMKKFLAQRARNIIACVAIILTTFMLYSILSIGISYSQSLEKQHDTINGTTADMLLTNPTDSQLAVLKDSGLCRFVGIGRQVAVFMDSKIDEAGINAANLRYADSVYWDKQIKPALAGVKGNYPKEENEIMLPEWAAEKLGIDTNKTGEEISLSFYYGGTNTAKGYGRLSDNSEEVFVVSGFYKDNSVDYIRNVATVYVSEAFWESAPYGAEKYKSAVYLSLRKANDVSEVNNLLALDDNQELTNMCSDKQGISDRIWEVVVIILVIMVCGGLIIYNVFYISVVQDIRFLGQLKTLGMTKRQLKKYLYFQIRWLCFIGIPVGLVLGMLISKLVVPFAIKAVAVISISKQNIEVSFSPVMIGGTILFSAFTVFLGSLRPLNFVGRVTPIAAMRYTNVRLRRKERKKEQSNIASIALRNIFRSRKNAVIVFLSLFLGSMLYLSIDGIFSGISPSALVGESMRYDLAMRDQYMSGNITEEALEQIDLIEGVKRAEIQRAVWMDGENEDSGCWLEVKDTIVEDYCTQALNLVPKYKEEQERMWKRGNKYACNVIGIGEIEFDLISKDNNLDVDYERFKAGEIGLWLYADYENAEIIVENVEVNMKTQIKEVSIEPQVIYSDSFHGGRLVLKEMAPKAVVQTGLHYPHFIAPNVIVSNEVLQTSADNYISEIDILTEGSQYDDFVLQAVKKIWGDSEDIAITSKKEKTEGLKEAFLSTRMLGGALSLILFFIGIMNFINSIYASILTRRKELAVLECIGMSKKQVKKMLVAEGLMYMGITCILIFTIGTVIYWTVFKIFSEIVGFIEFVYPWTNVCMLLAIMLIMAIVTPLFAYHSISEESAVEQVRRVE